jgi:hypothetical protein
VQHAKIIFNRVFIKENATSFLRKISSPFFLHELRSLTPLKTIDRFTSLMVIGIMKIMCNKHTYVECKEVHPRHGHLGDVSS